jgi:hypothetical protein
MGKPEKARHALHALQAVIIRARSMAHDLGNAQDLTEILDDAEYLPDLLAREEDETENHRRVLEKVARRHRCATALQRFDGEVPAGG